MQRDSLYNPSADAMLPRLRGHVDVLAELIGERNSRRPEALVSARQYITRQLDEIGLAPQVHRFGITGRTAENLEVVLPGQDERRPTLVIGAHYDTAIGTPGADDNASAVALLLEILRGLERAPRRTLRAVFYDTEEMPHFATREMGSQHHAQQCRQRGERLMGMICLESLGYFDLPHPVEYVPRWMATVSRITGGGHAVLTCTPGSAPFMLRLWRRMLGGGGLPILPVIAPRLLRPIELSDHRSYWDEGYAAVMLTDTAFLRNPHYHRSTDRLATLNLPAMVRLGRQLTAAVVGMTA